MTILQRGAFLTKEAPADQRAGAQAAEILLKELGDIGARLEANQKATDTQYRELHNFVKDAKTNSDEAKATALEQASNYAILIADQQKLTATVDQIKKELDAPIIRGGNILLENDVKASIELQRRAFLFKGGDPDEFKPDMENLVCAADYREAVRLLMKVGIESKAKIVRAFPERLRKAFEAASLDAAMFSPELLGITIDCNIECADINDLYGQVTVGKSTFMYPQVIDYGAIGKYDCDAKCDAEYGPEGNITYKSGNVSDFRGVFCLHRKTLAEANYDLLSFMYNAASRSHRIARNRALMIGTGVNEPLGWLSGNCFPIRKTAAAAVTHIEFRLFYASVPVEYGPVTAVMHQNTFAHLAAQVDSVGRFIFGDGLMTYSPADVRENIRISNCLPDPTAGLTKGSTANPFTAGDFICAAGAWKTAYYAVNKRPLWIEQWEGQSSAWCVKYQFGAEDGGFTGCCPAASILTVGP